MFQETDLAIYLQFFIGLIAIMNPFGFIPVYMGLTSHLDEQERAQSNRTAAFAAMIALLIVLVFGSKILVMFGISIPSFRIAGGVMLLMIAFSMLRGQNSDVKQNKEEDREAANRESIAVVPLAIPILAGPGAMSNVIVYAAEHNSGWDMLAFAIVIAVACGVCWLVFSSAQFIEKALGKAGINIITRVMGLIMIAIGVEFFAQSIKEIFPTLAG